MVCPSFKDKSFLRPLGSKSFTRALGQGLCRSGLMNLVDKGRLARIFMAKRHKGSP